MYLPFNSHYPLVYERYDFSNNSRTPKSGELNAIFPVIHRPLQRSGLGKGARLPGASSNMRPFIMHHAPSESYIAELAGEYWD